MGFKDRLSDLGRAIARGLGDTPNNLVPSRGPERHGSVTVSGDTAMKASAVWASIRLRADAVSTMPLLTKREMPDGSIQQVPQLKIDGIGGDIDFEEWVYSTQSDLDLCGNDFGIIKDRDPFTGRPTRIELVPALKARVGKRGGVLYYQFGGERYSAAEVWHERQYTQAGSPIGLSPLHYAAMVIGQNLSALQFGNDYFNTGGLPTVQLKNTKKTLTAGESEEGKRRYKAAMEGRDIFVTGSDWELNIESIRADESQFLQTLNASAGDIARFMGVPADIIGVNASGSSVTYANITQRFLELLVLHLQPTLVRRERKFSKVLLPNKVFAKFDTKALLRLDPSGEMSLHAVMIAARAMAPDEIRALLELPPLTDEQTKQIQDLVAVKALPVPLIPKIKPEV
jgi:HK97 family phage portal protein